MPASITTRAFLALLLVFILNLSIMSAIVLQSFILPSYIVEYLIKPSGFTTRANTISLASFLFSLLLPNLAKTLFLFSPSKISIGKIIQYYLILNVEKFICFFGKI